MLLIIIIAIATYEMIGSRDSIYRITFRAGFLCWHRREKTYVAGGKKSLWFLEIQIFERYLNKIIYLRE